MARLLVKFTQGYSRYNKGDTAAFAADVAKKLCEGKGKVAKLMGDAADPDAGKSVVIGKLDTSEAQEFVAQARSELDGRALSLELRADSLDRKSRDLADREKALEARETATATEEPEVEPAPAEQDTTTEEPKGNGEPPKQGTKK